LGNPAGNTPPYPLPIGCRHCSQLCWYAYR